MADNNDTESEKWLPPPMPDDPLPVELQPADSPAHSSESMPVTFTETPVENMEIHHASHVHHKKKWKDYVFEFFMLFLAVSSGFLVENQREHYVEHLRAKE